MGVKYVVFSHILSIEKHIQKKWIGGVGDNAKFNDVDGGYYMWLDGSHEAIFIGHEEPVLNAGDRIRVTFERVKS